MSKKKHKKRSFHDYDITRGRLICDLGAIRHELITAKARIFFDEDDLWIGCELPHLRLIKKTLADMADSIGNLIFSAKADLARAKFLHVMRKFGSERGKCWGDQIDETETASCDTLTAAGCRSPEG